MNPVISDRFTTQMTEPFVVFLIGMRVNKVRQLSRWLQVANAFPPMVEVLKSHPEKGFLHGESFFRFFPLTTIMVSYWRSMEDLEHFARAKDDPHLEAWRKFNQKIGYDGSVGIWHETYYIEPGKYEAIYANMPMFGLAGASKNPISAKGGYMNSLRGRMTGKEPTPENQPEVAEIHY